jgi:putative transposase
MLVTTWPDDAPRGAIEAFCRTHQVSRSWFHKVRADTRGRGAVAAMELRSTKPRTSPAETNSGMVKLALQTRADLESGGLDHGPLSVQAKLRRQGLTPPSRATLARIFTRAGVVTPEPKKKPRSAYRRFIYPNPNGCWQIDATEWILSNGRKVAIFQLIDDHSRLALASLAASGETSEAAIRVVKLAISRHGVPQKFLSDNGAALNPTRRNRQGALVNHLRALGVTPITGKPGKPTTQGKNERVHRTLLKYLNAHPIPSHPPSTSCKTNSTPSTRITTTNVSTSHCLS